MEQKLIPYGRQSIDEEDIAAVIDVLHSDWLTTGPKVGEFEQAITGFVEAKEAVAVSSGTAALHAAMYALDIGPGDEVIVPAMTFAATANCVVYQGGTPVFADVDPNTLLIDPSDVERKITPKTKGIIAVDYAGQPCNYDTLHEIANRHQLGLVADACHSLGGCYKGRPVGTLADLTVFSFHPVKHITTGEGGMITTDNPDLAQRMRVFRNHGISTDHRQRAEQSSWYYEMVDLGYNYRITDFQCALGLAQLKKLTRWIERRQQIAAQYDAALSALPNLKPLEKHTHISHAYHLYVVKLVNDLAAKRHDIFSALREAGIGVNVHYIPVHLHPFYQNRFGTAPEMCLMAETAYKQILSLPIFADMTDGEIKRVVSSMEKVLNGF